MANIHEAGDVRVTEGFTPEVQKELAESNSIQAESSRRNSPLRTMHKGGIVAKTGPVILQKGETVIPAQTDSTQEDPQAPQTDDSAVAGEPVNLQRAYSKLNSAITDLFDGLGIRRSATVAHVAGEKMHEHIEAVSKVLPTIGGITANLGTFSHTKHDPNGGASVFHPADKLRTAIVPKDNDLVKAAIQACKTFVNKIESLVNETPEVKVAKSQLALISKNEGAGMTAYDLAAGLLSIPGPLIQLVARRHNFVKHGSHHAALTGPKA